MKDIGSAETARQTLPSGPADESSFGPAARDGAAADRSAPTGPAPEDRRTAALQNGNGSRGVSWPVVNFWLDAALLVAFILLVWVSAVLHLVFPAGVSGFQWKILGYGLTDWRNAQFTTLCGLGLGLIVHVMLHWSWVCGLVRTRILRRKGRGRDETGADTLWGVAFLAGLLHLLAGGLLAAWILKTRL